MDDFIQGQINDLQERVTALEGGIKTFIEEQGTYKRDQETMFGKMDELKDAMGRHLTEDDFRRLLTIAQNERAVSIIKRAINTILTAVVGAGAGSYIGHILGIWKGE